MACAVRYFWVALLRLRLSSLDKVPEPGAPTPLTTTPWPLFAMGIVLSSFAKSQLKLFMCLVCDSGMFLSKRFSLICREILSSHLRPGRRFTSQNTTISFPVARSCNYSYDNCQSGTKECGKFNFVACDIISTIYCIIPFSNLRS